MQTLKPETVADDFRAPVDMDLVSRQAAIPKTFYKLVYTCHGEEFRWEGVATSKSMANLYALAALVDFHPDFNRYKAVLVSSIEEVVS